MSAHPLLLCLNTVNKYMFIVAPIPENIYKWDRAIEVLCSLLYLFYHHHPWVLKIWTAPYFWLSVWANIQQCYTKSENFVDSTCSLWTVSLYLAVGCLNGILEGLMYKCKNVCGYGMRYVDMHSHTVNCDWQILTMQISWRLTECFSKKLSSISTWAAISWGLFGIS